jgi:hypothetical protein
MNLATIVAGITAMYLATRCDEVLKLNHIQARESFLHELASILVFLAI